MENTTTIIVNQTEYNAMQNRIAELEKLLKYYEQQLLSAKRHRFGSSSERMDADIRQMNLFGSEEIPPMPETEEIVYTRKKHKGKREEDLSGLPVEQINYELSEEERICPVCSETMRDIGVQTRRELKLIPAKVVVREHITHTYACRHCEQNSIKVPFAKTESPKPLISGSLASPSLVAHIAVQKYANGMPLYRLENGFRYDGASVSRQTMANWVIQCSERYLEAIYERLKQQLLKESVIHADETTVQILREPNRAAQTKSYEWIYRTSSCSNHKIAIYDYKETRSQEHPKSFLKDFKGLLHTDGYQAYHNLPPGIVVIGCWAHVRRRFEAIIKNMPKEKRKNSDAERGMAYIGALFDLERKFESLTLEDRYQKRLKQSKPISDAFFTWAQSLGALPKVPLGEACGYALSQKKYLENIYLDGRAEISNNRAERTVKSFVMGRKAWLFSCTPAGARASSVMYSIIETAKENGLHPFKYMEFLLETLPNINTSGIEALLPWSDSLPDYCFAPQTTGGKHNG